MLHRLPSNTLERNELFAILWSIRDPLMPPRRQLEDYCSTCHICDVLLSIVLVVSFSCTLLRRLVRCRGVSYAAAASRTRTFLCCGVSYAAAVSCTLLSLVRPLNNSLLMVPSGGFFMFCRDHRRSCRRGITLRSATRLCILGISSPPYTAVTRAVWYHGFLLLLLYVRWLTPTV